ncbi:[FeFe] hydrogenase H-cluster maturation GTPase HydF [Sedimentibacter sp. zth1]|uniref:[FeFe] hydrogenase H-cluster maturation GTPase HydF n=1 Tax=Sedimentibacter sp. zth1 TaxID=2816908 RepID=UPI001A933DDA|nr:[FeFe] hydrogenase H-cluster maturation GTPase HydF [Sedimentibacter sp. zth1]QSX06308.1 [FeFe] hydrogenase H-cluster maturation GTPase HydF [Sedimentibacter sp. zth1]
MNNTPSSNRIHITIFGKRNVGKSSLLNAIVGQDVSLVSSIKGTTTDPVNKAMELIPLGPVLFIDTAGLDDEGELGSLRVQRTLKVLAKTDFAIYVMGINDIDESAYKEAEKNFKKFHIPFMTVINKMDTVSKENLKNIREKYKDWQVISSTRGDNILQLKDELIKKIQADKKEIPIVGDLVPYNGKVVLVVPIDSEAPNGRLILPQVQLIRDCLDHGIKSYVVRDTELKSALSDLKDIDLVITDSQAFKKVNEIVPANIKLTSFSILLSRVKGDIDEFLKGINAIEKLRDNANILISESCTHNQSHEDIGRVKIPRGLNKYTGKKFNYDFKTGQDFPTDLGRYDLVIHCASCMFNRKAMSTRIEFCREKNVPITNYGMLLAYLSGILPRTIEIFKTFKGGY